MEFVCVMSVAGSLLSYTVVKEAESRYLAKLKRQPALQEGVPEQIIIKKVDGQWVCNPTAKEIVTNLIKCIQDEN